MISTKIVHEEETDVIRFGKTPDSVLAMLAHL